MVSSQFNLITISLRFTAMAGQDLNGPIPYDPAAPVSEQVRQSFFNSLRELHPDHDFSSKRAGKQRAESTERSTLAAARWGAEDEDLYLDSYLLHSPLETLEATMEAWRTMEELVLEGRIRRIGVSSELSILSCELNDLLFHTFSDSLLRPISRNRCLRSTNPFFSSLLFFLTLCLINPSESISQYKRSRRLSFILSFSHPFSQ